MTKVAALKAAAGDWGGGVLSPVRVIIGKPRAWKPPSEYQLQFFCKSVLTNRTGWVYSLWYEGWGESAAR